MKWLARSLICGLYQAFGAVHRGSLWMFSQDELKLWLTWDNQENKTNIYINYYWIFASGCRTFWGSELSPLLKARCDVSYQVHTKSELMKKSLTIPSPELDNNDDRRFMLVILLFLRWCPSCVFGVIKIILWNGLLLLLFPVNKGKSCYSPPVLCFHKSVVSRENSWSWIN